MVCVCVWGGGGGGGDNEYAIYKPITMTTLRMKTHVVPHTGLTCISDLYGGGTTQIADAYTGHIHTSHTSVHALCNSIASILNI